MVITPPYIEPWDWLPLWVIGIAIGWAKVSRFFMIFEIFGIKKCYFIFIYYNKLF